MIPGLSTPPTLAASVAAPASTTTIDLMAYYPGPIAATHKLRCTDGRFYTYGGDMEGFWWRSIDPGCYDYHLWTPDLQYYFGFLAGDGLHWAVPPTLALPRYWDPTKPYARSSVEFYLHRKNAFDLRLDTAVQTLITIDSVTERGESLYRFYGLMGTESETWYLSPALPVAGGGSAPGMRGAVFTRGGQTTAVWEFDAWVPL